jgi:hexokinase
VFESSDKVQGVPIKLTALINDTTGTLIASAYTDTKMKIGCIFGTGCNAAYMENCGSIPKLAHMNLPPDTPMAINCEWGAFDNEHKVLPRTPYDIIIDKESPRPGQQAFEKMIAGLYLGELFRLVLVDLHDNKDVHIFEGEKIDKLRKAYTLDSSFLSLVEELVVPKPKVGHLPLLTVSGIPLRTCPKPVTCSRISLASTLNTMSSSSSAASLS